METHQMVGRNDADADGATGQALEMALGPGRLQKETLPGQPAEPDLAPQDGPRRLDPADPSPQDQTKEDSQGYVGGTIGLGTADIRALQRDGWRFSDSGMHLGNGWMVWASKGDECKSFLLADPDRNPDLYREPELKLSDQLQLALP